MRASRWTLWAGLALVAPLPFYLLETGVVPPARLLQLASVVVALIAAEGPLGAAPAVAGLLLLQAAVQLALLWWIAGRAAAGIARAFPRRTALATAALVAALAVAAASADPYRTPFRTRSLRADLLQVYE